jgi:hypothetical protein
MAGARREMNTTHGLMEACMIGAAMARRYCCVSAEAAERENQNEYSTRRLDGRTGSQCSR